MKPIAALALLTIAAAPVPASDLLLRSQTPTLEFRWRVAPEVATAPALLGRLRTEALHRRTTETAVAASDAAEAGKGGYPFRRHSHVEDWSLAADTPHLLALVATTYSFTGGAHGNTGLRALIWDKRLGKTVRFADLFSDWPKARAILEPAYCRALAAEQVKRRGESGGGTLFDACPALADQPVLPFADLASTAGQFRVLLAPYVAGSYAEGSYLITLPWPDEVRPLVKPDYKGDLFGGP